MLDDIDREILFHLMADGRSSWSDLAGRVGLSAPAVAERVRRLESRGVIRGYSALLTPGAVGCGITAFVSITLDRSAHRARFLDCVHRLPEVQECHHVAGTYDYLLKARCHDARHLDELLSGELSELPGINRTCTTIVLTTEKESVALPVPPP